ncbi:hypothetical protein T08_1250, partial [Trichinella sp. T8]
MEKKTVLKRRAAEETKTVPQIYHEEASSASADLETAEENLSILSEYSVWFMDGTFKIVPEWYQQMFTIHVFLAGVVLQPQTVICDFVFALIPLMQRTFPGIYMQSCYFYFCQAVLWKVTDLGMRTSYIHGEQYKDATGSIAALFNYFRVEWMPPDRLPMWNVYNVNIRKNNNLEGWHFKMNRLAGKRHFSFYELLQLLIDEQGSTEALN